MNRNIATYELSIRKSNLDHNKNWGYIIVRGGPYHDQEIEIDDVPFAQYIVDTLNKVEKDSWWTRLLNQYRSR